MGRSVVVMVRVAWNWLTLAIPLRTLRSSGNEVEWITPSRDPMTEAVNFTSSTDSIRKAVLEKEGGNFAERYLNSSDEVECC